MIPNLDLDLLLCLGAIASNIPADTDTLPETGRTPETKDIK